MDPLEVIFVREVMRTSLIAFEGTGTIDDARSVLRDGHSGRGQHLYPVIDADGRLSGGITRKDLAAYRGELTRLSDVARPNPIVAVADEPLSTVVYRMAESGYTRMPVVDNNEEHKIVGMVSLEDLFHARARNLTEERSRGRPRSVCLRRKAFGPGDEAAVVGPEAAMASTIGRAYFRSFPFIENLGMFPAHSLAQNPRPLTGSCIVGSTICHCTSFVCQHYHPVYDSVTSLRTRVIQLMSRAPMPVAVAPAHDSGGWIQAAAIVPPAHRFTHNTLTTMSRPFLRSQRAQTALFSSPVQTSWRAKAYSCGMG